MPDEVEKIADILLPYYRKNPAEKLIEEILLNLCKNKHPPPYMP